MKLRNATFEYGALLLASLSMFGLVVEAYKVGLTAPIQAMNDFYQSVLRTVLHPIELALSNIEYEPPEQWRQLTVVASMFSIRLAQRLNFRAAWILPPLSILAMFWFPAAPELGALNFILFEIDLAPIGSEITSFSIVLTGAMAMGFWKAFLTTNPRDPSNHSMRPMESVILAIGDFGQIVLGTLGLLAASAGLSFLGIG